MSDSAGNSCHYCRASIHPREDIRARVGSREEPTEGADHD
jgi:hypothetical protein